MSHKSNVKLSKRQKSNLIKEEFDLNQDRPAISDRHGNLAEEISESERFSIYDRCGGGRRVMRKRIGN